MTDPIPLATIGVCKTYGSWYDRIIGKAIRWFTATEDQYGHFADAKVNHAVVYVGAVAGKDKPQLVQAQPGGAGFADWDSYGDNMIWLTNIGSLQTDGTLAPLPMTDVQRQAIASYAKDCAIKKIGYNYLDFIAIAFAQKRFGSRVAYSTQAWWVKRLANTKHLICSQLADYAYSKAGVQLFADLRLPGLVSPADLLALEKE